MSLRLPDNLLNHYSSSFHGNANADFFDAANYARVQFREREALAAKVFVGCCQYGSVANSNADGRNLLHAASFIGNWN